MMSNSRFTFDCLLENDEGEVTTSVTVTLSGESITSLDVTRKFVQFLRGCGVQLPAELPGECSGRGECDEDKVDGVPLYGEGGK